MAGGSGDALPELGNIIGLVRGGMGGITQALARSAEAQGVEIRTSAEVRRVVVDGSRATGVELVDGSEVRARVVLSNADPKRTFLRLVDPGPLPLRISSRPCAASNQRRLREAPPCPA